MKKALEERGKQLVKYNIKKSLQRIENKKKFLKSFLIREWKKYKF